MKQFLYVMKSSAGRTKVGIAADPEARRGTIESTGGYAVELLTTLGPFNDASRLEALVHTALASSRAVGEWFDCDSQDASSAAKDIAARFVDGEDNGPVSVESIDGLVNLVVRMLAEPLTKATDLAESLVSELERKQAAYEALVEEFSEACRLVDEFAKMAHDAQLLARRFADKSAAQEEQIRRLTSSASN